MIAKIGEAGSTLCRHAVPSLGTFGLVDFLKTEFLHFDLDGIAARRP